MLQRMFPFYIQQIIWFLAEERSTRGSEYDLLDGIAHLSYETLKYRGMLRIHRDYRNTFGNGRLHNDVTCHHQSFFIRESDGFARADRIECGLKTCIANNSCEHQVIYIHR